MECNYDARILISYVSNQGNMKYLDLFSPLVATNVPFLASQGTISGHYKRK